MSFGNFWKKFLKTLRNEREFDIFLLLAIYMLASLGKVGKSVSDDSTGRLWTILLSGGEAAVSGSAGSFLIDLLVVFVLILINAFFAATEIAVVTLNDNKVRRMAEEGHQTAKKILAFLERPGNFLATIQVGVTFAGFLSSAFAADKFSGRLALLLNPAGNSAAIRNISLVGITLFLAFLNLVLGELVPKRIAQKYPEKVSFAVAGIIQSTGAVLKPFVFLLTKATNGILRLMRIDPNEIEKGVTEEEIRMMVDVGSESGSIQDGEKTMIENIFEFNDKEVSEIMTHRTKIVSLDENADYDEVMQLAAKEKYTRVPVYQENIDNIVGILHIKDLLTYLTHPEKRESFSLKTLMRPPVLVPETKNLSSLFTQMQKERLQIVVVLDEYGGTAGIVTVEDILEEIVGNISDEFDEEEPQIVSLADGDLLVTGDASLKEIEDIIGVDFPDEDYDTIAGFIFHLLDRIPEENERPEVVYDRVSVKVVSMDDKWISKLRIHVFPPKESEKEDEDQ